MLEFYVNIYGWYFGKDHTKRVMENGLVHDQNNEHQESKESTEAALATIAQSFLRLSLCYTSKADRGRRIGIKLLPWPSKSDITNVSLRFDISKTEKKIDGKESWPKSRRKGL